MKRLNSTSAKDPNYAGLRIARHRH